MQKVKKHIKDSYWTRKGILMLKVSALHVATAVFDHCTLVVLFSFFNPRSALLLFGARIICYSSVFDLRFKDPVFIQSLKPNFTQNIVFFRSFMED